MNSDTKSGEKILLYVGIVILSYLAAFLLTPPAWTLYNEFKGVGPDSAGSAEQADTPAAHSIREMEQLDRFVIHMSKPRESPDLEFFKCSNQAYTVLTLDSGERVASKIYLISAHYDPPNERWHLPIGKWTPWNLTEAEEQSVLRQELSLSTLDFYVDMEGNQRTAIRISKKDFVTNFQFITTWCFIVLALLIRWIIILLRRCRWEINRPQNEVELWIASTHALWGLAFARACKMGHKNKEKDPIRIGGTPKSPKSKQIVRSVLSEQWDITNYATLLETVSYMSEGEGFYRCETQSARAWQLCRSTSLLGMAYVAGWAEREEIIQHSRKICLRIQDTFESWDDLYVNFLDHYAAWHLSTDGMTAAAQTDIQQRADIYWELKRRANSPCKLPWNLKLNP